MAGTRVYPPKNNHHTCPGKSRSQKVKRLDCQVQAVELEIQQGITTMFLVQGPSFRSHVCFGKGTSRFRWFERRLNRAIVIELPVGKVVRLRRHIMNPQHHVILSTISFEPTLLVLSSFLVCPPLGFEHHLLGQSKVSFCFR